MMESHYHFTHYKPLAAIWKKEIIPAAYYLAQIRPEHGEMNQLPAGAAFGNNGGGCWGITEVRGAIQGLFPGVGPVEVLRIILPRPSPQPVERPRPEPAAARVRGTDVERGGGSPGRQRAGKGGGGGRGERGGIGHDAKRGGKQVRRRICSVQPCR